MSISSLAKACPSSEDAGDLQSLWADPLVGESLGGARSPSESDRTLDSWCGSWKLLDLGPWIFRFVNNHEFVGYSGLLPTRPGNMNEAQLMYAVRPDLWGRGFCTRMGQEALADRLSRFPSLRVVAFALSRNLGSRKVLEKLNFREIGEIERTGLPHLLYELNR